MVVNMNKILCLAAGSMLSDLAIAAHSICGPLHHQKERKCQLQSDCSLPQPASHQSFKANINAGQVK